MYSLVSPVQRIDRLSCGLYCQQLVSVSIDVGLRGPQKVQATTKHLEYFPFISGGELSAEPLFLITYLSLPLI